MSAALKARYEHLEFHEQIEAPEAPPAAQRAAERVIQLRSLVQVLSDLAEACAELGELEAAHLIRRYARTPEAGLTWTREPPAGEHPERSLKRIIGRVTGPAPWLREARRLMVEERYP